MTLELDNEKTTTEKTQITLGDVVDYIYERRAETHLARFTHKQVLSYVFGLLDAKHIRIVGTDKVEGVVIFNPNQRGEFWVNQVWGSDKAVMRDFMAALAFEYPFVEKIYGNRPNGKRNMRTVCFNVSTLKKIYGR